MTARRQDAGAAVAGLFANPTATGGLAGRENGAARSRTERRAELGEPARDGLHIEQGAPVQRADGAVLAETDDRPARVRVGVELTEEQSAYLRALSRPGRTNGPRSLGTKFVATGVLVAAIELLRSVDVDMHGVAAGDEPEMAARARAALRKATRNESGGAT
jgi:hypothetical protein